MTPKRPADSLKSPREAPKVRSTIASAPGPEMNGNASGNTEMSARFFASTRSFEVWRVPDSRAKTISSAIRNSMMPPAMRNASMLMPMTRRNQVPPTANSRNIVPESRTAFSAMRRRNCVVRALGQRRKQRHERDRLDDHEEEHEELQEFIEHPALPRHLPC